MKINLAKIILVLVASILVVLLVSDPTVAQKYIITDLGQGIASDTNNLGQVVGTYYPSPTGARKCFYWDSIRGRENLDFGEHGGFESINGSGEAVSLNFNHPPKGFLWNSTTGETIEIPIFPLTINNTGQVAGWTSGGPGGGDLAVIWDNTNGIQVIASGIDGNARDINNLGQVIGDNYQSAFVWNSLTNEIQYISPIGGTYIEAQGVNDLVCVGHVKPSRCWQGPRCAHWYAFVGQPCPSPCLHDSLPKLLAQRSY